MKTDVIFRELLSGIYRVEIVKVEVLNDKGRSFVASLIYTEGQIVTNIEVVKEINNFKSYVRVLDKDWNIIIEQVE